MKKNRKREKSAAKTIDFKSLLSEIPNQFVPIRVLIVLPNIDKCIYSESKYAVRPFFMQGYV